jgi:hypothetical protein
VSAREVPPCWPGSEHCPLRESDGAVVCQVCGEVLS